MLEYWNNGIDDGRLEYWVLKARKHFFPFFHHSTIPFFRLFFISPFHHSTIPFFQFPFLPVYNYTR